MKIFNEKTKIIFPIFIFVGLTILIIFLQKEFIEKSLIIIPFVILWLTYIKEKRKENKREGKEKIEKQKDIQYFFEKLMEWISGGKERSSYLENYVVKNSTKYQRIFGISILKWDELSPDEYNYYHEMTELTSRVLGYLIYILEGKYILEYSFEHMGYGIEVDIGFKVPKISNSDSTERKKMEEKVRKDMIKEIIEYVREEHGFELKYQEKKN